MAGHIGRKWNGGENSRLRAAEPGLPTCHWSKWAHAQPPEAWESPGGTGVGHSPLVGQQVKLPIQLAHGDGLGVEHIVIDGLVHAATDGRLSLQ